MQGRRFVLRLYVLLVLAAGLAGVLVAVSVDDLLPPRLFFLVPLPPTALGFALYGAVTVGTVLGLGLLLVEYASQAADAETAEETTEGDRRAGKD